MKFFLAASAVVLFAGAQSASAQGPIREGLRETGGAVVDGTRAVVDGTGRAGHAVVGGAADATRAVGNATINAAEATGHAARNVAGAAADGVRAGVHAVTPIVPAQARIDAQARFDAPWRTARHNNEWWYYSPRNTWMYHRDGQWNEFSQDSYRPVQPYAAGYRAGASVGHGGRAHHLRVDQSGREYIVQNGQRVYFNQSSNSAAAPQAAPTAAPAVQPTPAPAATAPGAAVAPATPVAPAVSAEASVQAQGQPQADDANRHEGSPEAPRELNNNPNPAPEGKPSTTGARGTANDNE